MSEFVSLFSHQLGDLVDGLLVPGLIHIQGLGTPTIVGDSSDADATILIIVNGEDLIFDSLFLDGGLVSVVKEIHRCQTSLLNHITDVLDFVFPLFHSGSD
jgi:hypothetical protein